MKRDLGKEKKSHSKGYHEDEGGGNTCHVPGLGPRKGEAGLSLVTRTLPSWLLSQAAFSEN